MSILGGEVKVNKKGWKKMNREEAWKKRRGLANDYTHMSYYFSSPFIDKQLLSYQGIYLMQM